jgi:peptide/nickel transport system ATP-binding protein
VSAPSSTRPIAKPLLEVRGLRTYFDTEAGVAKAVDDVSFDVYEGEVLGVVGESGSGKSVTALSILRLIPSPPGRIVEGSIRFKGRELLQTTIEEIRAIRGHEIAMVFQEPMTSLNPVFTIGMQLTEAVLAHEKVSRREAERRAVAMLERVGIANAAERLKDYPHQFSGGMRQRVMIAMALLGTPSLLIADEPTTALDVTIQAQILELMMNMKAEQPGAAILLITHNLAVVAETCDRVMVMYGGKIQEVAGVHELFHNPLHPYTQGLLASLPEHDAAHEKRPGERLTTIPGNVPSILEMPVACKFNTRCPARFDKCFEIEPELLEVAPRHLVRCHLMTVPPEQRERKRTPASPQS